MNKRRKVSEITDIVKALREHSRQHDEIRKYFYFDSQVCRALQEYLEKDPKPHCLFKCGRRVLNTSAHSGVHFRDAHVSISNMHAKQQEEVIVFTFEVDLYDEDERETQERVTVYVPALWESDFSKAKFDKWVKEEKSKIVKNPDRQIILGIAKKYDIPLDQVKRFLDCI